MATSLFSRRPTRFWCQSVQYGQISQRLDWKWKLFTSDHLDLNVFFCGLRGWGVVCCGGVHEQKVQFCAVNLGQVDPFSIYIPVLIIHTNMRIWPTWLGSDTLNFQTIYMSLVLLWFDPDALKLCSTILVSGSIALFVVSMLLSVLSSLSVCVCMCVCVFVHVRVCVCVCVCVCVWVILLSLWYFGW